MKRSPEIEAVIRRFLGAVEAADLATVRATVHPSEHTIILGSDPSERVVGPDSIEFLAVQAEHRRKDYTYNITRLEAFEHDRVGWASLEVMVEFSADEPKPNLRYEPVHARITAVFLLEQAMWRIIQWHFSTPVPDDPAVSGEELTEAMYDMIRALEGSSQVSQLTSRLETNTVSLVFTDIVDSTVRAGQTGDEAWTAIITRHLADTERVAARNEGFVVKTTGDGAMLAFSSARKAVRAAIELRRAATEGESPLKLRIGVHVGEAVKTDVDYFGQAVNEAARVMAAAEPEQILVTDVVRSLVGDLPGIGFDTPLNLELKGISGSRKVHPVVVHPET